MARSREIDRYRKALTIAVEALRTYADPGFYHAITIIGDRPTGGFDEDVSRVRGSQYTRPMPGKQARDAIRTLERRYATLELEPIEIDNF